MTTAVEAGTRPVETDSRAEVLGCQLDRLDMEQTVARCDEVIASRGFAQHMAINAAKLVAMQDDEELQSIIERCELVTADGQAIVWASRILRDPLPSRVAGIDLMLELFALAARKGYRVYVVGARPDVLERAMKRLRELYPGLPVAGYRDGYFKHSEEAEVAAEIRAAAPDLLFVAMSSPRKEYFLGKYGRATGASYVMGVGGAIDVVAGVTARAPRLLQRLGLEWLFRLLQEPKRLGPRYLKTNVRFIKLVQTELRRRRGRAAEAG